MQSPFTSVQLNIQYVEPHRNTLTHMSHTKYDNASISQEGHWIKQMGFHAELCVCAHYVLLGPLTSWATAGFQGNLRNDRKHVIRPVPVTALEDFLQRGLFGHRVLKGAALTRAVTGFWVGFLFFLFFITQSSVSLYLCLWVCLHFLEGSKPS